jgi:hypothetical protein
LVTKRTSFFISMAVAILLSIAAPFAMAFTGNTTVYTKLQDYKSSMVNFDLAYVPAMKLDKLRRGGATDTAFGGDGSKGEYIKKRPVSKNFKPVFYKHYVGSRKRHKDRPGWS